ncbi:hypothetical protein TeGR_g15178 [Tetraparma gracilis]|uniref:Uncharacterized protein n=1 Tax=Tetraparma gracilis TaxID=2962635 RepID=A0ABQ6N975_9STRA|nr:hypothetical protein TeGR_g15178 [Tetraparma gracilis]
MGVDGVEEVLTKLIMRLLDIMYLLRATNRFFRMDAKVLRCATNLVQSVDLRGGAGDLQGEAAVWYRVFGDFQRCLSPGPFEHILGYASWGDMGEGLAETVQELWVRPGYGEKAFAHFGEDYVFAMGSSWSTEDIDGDFEGKAMENG